MKTKELCLKIRLHIVSLLVLLLGMASSTAIYLTVEDIPENVFHDYEHSKIFRHEMEAVGGKLNMLLSELCCEFARLWQGKTLAYSVATLTIVLSSVIFMVERHLRDRRKPESESKD